jgi:hypothetical protein
VLAQVIESKAFSIPGIGIIWIEIEGFIISLD